MRATLVTSSHSTLALQGFLPLLHAHPSVGDESISEQLEEMSVSNSVMSEDTPPQAADGMGSTNGTPAPNSQTPGHPSFRRYVQDIAKSRVLPSLMTLQAEGE